MNGSVLFEGNPILSGSLNVNTGGKIEPLEVEINENGTRTITPPSGVDGYAPITIETNVPQIEPVLETLNVTQNGRYEPPEGVAGFDEVNVEVLHPLDTLTVTENGSYEPPTGVYGFSNVNVNVPTPTPTLETLNITQNGTYTPPSGVDGYDEINVNVPAPENTYLLEEYGDVPTDIASFTASDNPLKSLTASIVPVQAGSGDPSPTNVRPITGWTEEVITRTGKNVFGGLQMAENIVEVGRNATLDTTNKTVTFTSSVPKDDSYERSISEGFKFKENTIYTFIVTYSNSGNNGSLRFRNTTGTNQEITLANTNGQKTKIAVTTWSDINLKDIILSFYSASSTTLYYEESGLFEGVITAQDFEPYAGTTTTIPFTDGQGQSVEVFGGSVDVVNGEVTPCPYYASYNGEQLTGEWISDRDVYSPNTTPTTGAQVVNIGATGTPFSVQPTSIKSLDGVNNVFASTGDVEELKYFADL